MAFIGNVLPGNHVITEAPQKGWTLTNAICSNGQDPSNLDLNPGDAVTCTFTNTKNATITVIKTVNNCVLCNGGVATANQFTMNVVYNGGSMQFPGNTVPGNTISILPGLYQVSELATGPSGYVASYHGACFGSVSLVIRTSARSSTTPSRQ